MDTRIHIEYNEKHNFNRVYCDEGYVMTDWDKQDIMTYSSTKEMFCPVAKDLAPFYILTDAEDEEIKRQQILIDPALTARI